MTERIYIRGSNDKIDTRNQLVELRAASRKGLVYKDVKSGAKKREELERMINETQPGDVILVWSLDRLSREGIRATLEYLKRITDKKARFQSLKEPWLDSQNPCYELIVSCMSFAAKMERMRMAERLSTSIRRRRATTDKPVLDRRTVAETEGSTREVALKFKCSHVYVFQCRKEFGIS